MSNYICRRQQPDSYPERFPVPIELVDWQTHFPGYEPNWHDQPRAETPEAKAGDYPDRSDPTQVDWSKRYAFSGDIQFKDGYPLNPGGRTGITGRGMLNAWGPTLAVDAIITTDELHGYEELLVIDRADNGRPALPAGKLTVNASNQIIEKERDGAKRETFEETGVLLDFSGAREVFRGYVDDERNTDNAWMESVALHLRLSARQAGKLVMASIEVDAERPRWETIDHRLLNNLNAMNGYMVRRALYGSNR